MSKSVTILMAVFVVAISGGMVAWWAWPEAKREEIRVSHSSVVGKNLCVFLVPVNVTGERKDAVQVWENLFSDLAQDATSQDFLQKLYGGVKVEVKAPAPAADWPRLESNGVLLKINPQQPGEVRWDKIVSRVGGRSDQPTDCLLGTLDYSRVACSRSDAATDESLAVLAAKAIEAQMSDLNVVVMAANEYLLRHQLGWRMVDHFETSLDQLPKLSKDPTDVRQELDQEVAAWYQRYTKKATVDESN